MTEQLHFCFSLSCIGEGNGTPFQHSCLENPRDGGAWWAAVYGVAQSRTRLKRLSSSNSSKHCILRIYWDSIYLLSFHSTQLKWFIKFTSSITKLFSLLQLIMQVKQWQQQTLDGLQVLIFDSEYMVFWAPKTSSFMGFSRLLLRKRAQHSRGGWRSPVRREQCFAIPAGHLAFGPAHRGALGPLCRDCCPGSFSICHGGPGTKFEWCFHCVSLAPASSLRFHCIILCHLTSSPGTLGELESPGMERGVIECLDSLCSLFF